MLKLANFINGYLQVPAAGRYIESIDPATGQAFAQVPNSDEKDLAAAIQAAERAWESWRKMPAESRADLLYEIGQLIEDNLTLFAEAESRDTGKPITVATQVDIARAASNFKFFAHACSQFSSEAHAQPSDAINFTLRQPLGIVACISPWNLPLYLLSWKIAPALAAGNCVIAKPSEVTPYTAHLLSEICIQAGLPQGVLNILHGQGQHIGDALCRHPKIKAVSFTGGSQTGKNIATAVAPQLKKLSLELGGKNAALVFADCDLEQTVAQLIRASFSNQGQICLCASRIYIQSSIYETFKAQFIAKLSQLNCGDPTDPACQFGAISSKQHWQKIMHYIDLAKISGAKVLTGGNAYAPNERCQNGYFIQPTVIEGLDQQHPCLQQEIFGPVVCLMPFDDEQQALTLANDSQYGLSATIWTSNLSLAHRLAERIHAGVVWVNCWLHRDLRTPFGGMNQSGSGREGGHEIMRFFTEPKNVCIKYQQE